MNSSAPISGEAALVVQSISEVVIPDAAVPSKERLAEEATSRCKLDADTNTGKADTEAASRPVSACHAARLVLFVPPVVAKTYVPGPAPAA